MTDRELLEAAARAAGIEVQWRDSVQCLCYSGSPYNVAWNPLTDDGDALRLAVALGIDISFHPESLCVYAAEEMEPYTRTPDPCAATRRAIVRAAASMGETA